MKKKCSIKNCERDSRRKGFCAMHYLRVRAGITDMNPNSIRGKSPKKKGMNQREKNGMWKGEFCGLLAGRCRAHRWFSIDKCQICGKKAKDRHHKDGNLLNNSPDNIQPLCRRCHMEADGRMKKIVDGFLVIPRLQWLANKKCHDEEVKE